MEGVYSIHPCCREFCDDLGSHCWQAIRAGVIKPDFYSYLLPANFAEAKISK